MIAAETRELTGLASQLSGRRALSSLPVAYAEEGELGGRRWMLGANGPGPRLAAAAFQAFPRPDRVVSVGYCGALDPALRIADVVVCHLVIEADTNRRFAAAGQFGATCLSGDRVIQTSREKAHLRETTGASVVEMEAAGVAAGAEAAGVPFHCIRVVTDTALEDMDVDFNAARGEDGRFSAGRIAMHALRRPHVRFRELYELSRRAREATEKLGAYLGKHPF